jgi:hypothetical protein
VVAPTPVAQGADRAGAIAEPATFALPAPLPRQSNAGAAEGPCFVLGTRRPYSLHGSPILGDRLFRYCYGRPARSANCIIRLQQLILNCIIRLQQLILKAHQNKVGTLFLIELRDAVCAIG